MYRFLDDIGMGRNGNMTSLSKRQKTNSRVGRRNVRTVREIIMKLKIGHADAEVEDDPQEGKIENALYDEEDDYMDDAQFNLMMQAMEEGDAFMDSEYTKLGIEDLVDFLQNIEVFNIPDDIPIAENKCVVMPNAADAWNIEDLLS